MTEVTEQLLTDATKLLAAPLPHDTEQSARIMLAALVAALEGRMVGVAVEVVDQDGASWLFTHRGVIPEAESSLQPIARIQ